MMRTPLSDLSLVTPRSLRQAFTLLREDPTLSPLAGGTDLYVTLNAGTEKRRRFLDLSRLAELTRIRVDGDRLSIGALATFTAIARSSLVSKRVPILREAALQVGGIQIQNRGTLGGNIGNASPAGDSLPVLAATDAVIVLGSHQGTRRIPYCEFATGYRTTQRHPEELIVAVEIPRIHGKPWFRKVGTRAAQAISKVVAAGVRNGNAISFALGAVGPVIVRARNAERVFGETRDVTATRRALLHDIAPIDDIRSTKAYRTTVAQNLVAMFLAATDDSRSAAQ